MRELLGLDKVTTVLQLFRSQQAPSMEKKDIIKIDESIELDLDVLGYIDSNITVNRVKIWETGKESSSGTSRRPPERDQMQES